MSPGVKSRQSPWRTLTVPSTVCGRARAPGSVDRDGFGGIGPAVGEALDGWGAAVPVPPAVAEGVAVAPAVALVLVLGIALPALEASELWDPEPHPASSTSPSPGPTAR
jgi:hypothetical protein